jgi:hypothetical protein
VLRLWLAGEGLRSIARLARMDRKTVRRYVEAAAAAGVVRGGGVEQLSDAVVGVVCAAVRPARPGGHAGRCVRPARVVMGWRGSRWCRTRS